jgi:opacity protein-like surface antigen
VEPSAQCFVLMHHPITGEPNMKKAVLSAAAALVLSAASAFAQNANPPAAPGPGNKAVNSPNTNNSDKPVSGANSFTEGQAKSRIESGGYSKVSDLKKDDDGVWRGKATKDGKSVDVSLDFQGNVTAR